MKNIRLIVVFTKQTTLSHNLLHTFGPWRTQANHVMVGLDVVGKAFSFPDLLLWMTKLR
jgi:hypothetical protein